MKSRITSLILALSLFSAMVPVFAENAQSNEFDVETQEFVSEIVQEESPTQRPQHDAYYNIDISDEQEENVQEPEIHTETIPDNLNFSEEEYNLMGYELPDPFSISLFSTTDTTDDLWNSLFAEQFGDDYLKPYEKNEDGQRISGNTNRLTIEETDLSLPGKNGLDVVLKRRHDNQDYNEVYSAVKDSNGVDTYQHKYMATFINTSTNKKINVAFYTEDDLYAYMYDGCRLKDLDTTKIKSRTINGITYTFYNFSYILGRMTNDESYDYYEYDDSVDCVEFYDKHDDGSIYSLVSRKLLSNRNYVGNGWTFLMPEVYLYKYSYEKETSHDGEDDEYSDYDGEYVGAFRDIDGNVYSLEGTDTYRKYKYNNNYENTYTSSFSCDGNNYLTLTKIFIAQQMDDGTAYNFTVRDNRGYTYYLYNPEAAEVENPKTRQPVSIVAVEDDYGNRIRYKYDSDFDKVIKIIDTYGREINIDYNEGNTVVSYYDDIAEETKTITYETSILPSASLDNDSPIKEKEVQRLTVTNQLGEQTIYDARVTQVINAYHSDTTSITGYPDIGDEWEDYSKASNIERIIYPTGAETRYTYQCIYPHSDSIKVTRGVYAVTKSYDIVNGQEVNKNEYSFTRSGYEITITGINESADSKTVSVYDSDGLISSEKTTPISATRPYYSTSYTYDDKKKPAKITFNDNGLSNKTTYSYSGGLPNRLLSETTDKKQISYTYHTKDGKSTDKIETATYKYKSGDDYITDYVISTELTADEKAIEYERVTKNSVIKSQTKYEYDNEGNVIATKQWTDDTNSDGVLDENDEFTTASSTYTNTSQKTKNVINSVADITNADGVNEGNVTAEYKLNIYGLPTYNKDSYGTVTTVEYDELNRPVKYNLPNSGTKTIEYIIDSTAESNYTIVTDEVGIKYKNVYDGLGRIKEKYRLNGTSWNKLETYTYDNVGRLTQKTSGQNGAGAIKEVYTYDALNRVSTKKLYEGTSTLLYTENYAYNYSSGSLIVTKTTTAADGTQTAAVKTYYDKYGQVTKTEAVSEDTTLTTTFEYDYLGRVTKETDPNGNSTTYEYNYDGQVSKQTDAEGNVVTTQYDLAGQAISFTDANGNTTVTDYDKLGRAIKVTAPFDAGRNAITKTYYDKNSNVIKTAVRKEGNEYQTEEYKYDNMGNRIATISGDDDETTVVQYEYDTANRMTKMITGLTAYSENPTGGAITTYQYGTNGFLSKVTDPMGKSEEYPQYDYYGNVTEKIDRNGNVFDYTYGAYGVKIDNSWGGAKKENVYNSLGQIIKTINNNENGKTVEESCAYDPFGRMTSMTSSDGTVQNYTYDSNSNVLTYNMTKNDITQNSITYTYNNLNQLTALSNNDIITSYSYDANGNLTQQTLNNGLTTNYTYNNAGLITYKASKKGNDVYTYSNCMYLLNGQMQRVIMPYDGDNASENKIKTYQYDSLGRLKSESIAEAASQPIYNTYTYDSFGNRTQKIERVPDDNVITTINYQYDLNNRLIREDSETHDEYSNTESGSATRYYYDNNGNTLAEQKKTYTTGNESSSMTLSGRTGGSTMKLYQYDDFNRLIQYNDGGTEATYTYNTSNLRASKTVNGTTTNFVWNGQNLASETKDGETNTYTYDMTGVHVANQNGVVTSYLKDYHGNVVAKANALGSMIDEIYSRRDYDAFGNQWQGTQSDPFGYCGEYLDSESGLIYLRNRYYNSNTGRFITEDPVKDGLNWYVYCGGNPILFTDSFGLRYIWIREAAEKIGYSVEWNADTKKAHVVNTYKYYYDGDSRDSYIDENDNRLYVWDQTFYSDIMLTAEDRQNNITITIKDDFPYKNINVPLDNALDSIRSEAESKTLFKTAWFISKVNHEADWDIKREKPWNKTIGYGTYPGWGVSVYYHDMLMTPEELGNFTYGYIGAALGFSMDTLRTGSWLAAGLPTQKDDLMNEFTDWIYIGKGYDYY